MSVLFEPAKIKNLELRNRFVRSATYDGCADRAGHVSEEQIRLFKQLADGGVGLIVAGAAYVHSSGQFSSFQNSIATDACIPGLKRLTSAVHDGGGRIAIQLFHAGREAMREGIHRLSLHRCAAQHQYWPNILVRLLSG